MSFPPAQPHGQLRELFPDVFFVKGRVKLKSPPMGFSRAMTVVRNGQSLTIINSMRLSEEGMAALDELGKVEHVIRIASYHGMDDAFYKDRYDAKVWAMADSGYGKGFDTKTREADSYFQPDVWMQPSDELPLPNAKLFVYETASPREGLVLLEREGGILVAGDSLQNWRVDEYFTFLAKIMMRVMGFIKPYNIGSGWLKGSNPTPADVRKVLELDFEHVLPVHGDEVIGGAKEKYRPAIEGLS
jgi:hypothetical protein